MPDHARPVTNRDLLRRRGIVALLWTAFTGFGGFGVLLSTLPLWASTGGASPGVAGLSTTTVTLVATVMTQFAVPAVVSRLGAGPALAIGLLALGAPSPLYALTADPAALAAISVVRGVGFGLLTVTGSMLIAILSPQGAYGRTTGLYGLAVAVPHLVAVPGAVYLAENVSFTWPFWLAALPVLGAPAAFVFGRTGRRESGAAHRSWQPAAARAALPPALVLFVITLAAGGLLTVVPIGLTGTGVLASVALLVMNGIAAVSRFAVGSMADRRGAARFVPPVIAVTAVGVAVLAAGMAWAGSAEGGTVPTSAVVAVLVGSLLAGVGYGAVQNVTLVLAFARAGREGSATASTVWNAGYDTGTALGAVAVGAVAGLGVGLPGAIALTAVPVLAAALLQGRLKAGR